MRLLEGFAGIGKGRGLLRIEFAGYRMLEVTKRVKKLCFLDHGEERVEDIKICINQRRHQMRRRQV